MATWDSASLLAKFKLLAARPSTDAAITDAQIYLLLGEGQFYWAKQMAIHCPEQNMTSGTMSTSDSGATYTFPSSVTPLRYIIYTSATGDFMRPGSYDDPSADFVDEGSKIRMTRGATRTFSSGPFARYVAPTGDLDGSTAPTLLPTDARLLCVYHAVAEYMRQGGYGDPEPFERKEFTLAWGDPRSPGDLGIIGALKCQSPFHGMAAFAHPGLSTFQYIGQSSYQAL